MGLVVNKQIKSKIEGVIIIPLEQIEDERGAVLHMLRSDSPVFPGFGDIYFSSVNPKAVKAWKRHLARAQHFTVPVGRLRLVFFDDRAGSSSYGLTEELILGRPDHYYLICVPPMLWYGFQAISVIPALVANCIEKPYDPLELETIPISDNHIPYVWQTPHKDNLIIAVVGDRSAHRSWVRGKNRRFDTLLVYYGSQKNKFREDADYYMESREPGKFQKISLAIHQFRDKISSYKYVCLADDDIIASTEKINLLFDKTSEYDLEASQPSVAHGFIGHLITTRHSDCELRFVNFIESMCPVFKTGLLLNELLPTFTINRSSWGVEWIWAEIFVNKKAAILDCVAITHKNWVGMICALISHNRVDYYRDLKRNGISPIKELEELLDSVKPEIKDTLFVEKGRISKPLPVRILLLPLIGYENIKWRIFLIIKRFFQIFNTKIKNLIKGLNLKREAV